MYIAICITVTKTQIFINGIINVTEFIRLNQGNYLEGTIYKNIGIDMKHFHRGKKKLRAIHSHLRTIFPKTKSLN
jgi:hypothetical protein